MMMIVGEDFEPLDKVDPQLPPELIQLTHEMLAKDPDRRPAMQVVRDRLGRFLGRSSVSIVPLLSARSSSALDAPVSQSSSAAEGGIAATVDAPERGVQTPTASGMGGSGPHRLSGDRSTQQPRLGRGEPIEGALSSGIARTSGERIIPDGPARTAASLAGLGRWCAATWRGVHGDAAHAAPNQLPLKPPTEGGVSGATGTPPGPAAPQPGFCRQPASSIRRPRPRPHRAHATAASDPSPEGKSLTRVAVAPKAAGKPSRGKPVCNIVELSPACVSRSAQRRSKNKTVGPARGTEQRSAHPIEVLRQLRLGHRRRLRDPGRQRCQQRAASNFAKALRAFLRLPRLPGEIQIKCTASDSAPRPCAAVFSCAAANLREQVREQQTQIQELRTQLAEVNDEIVRLRDTVNQGFQALYGRPRLLGSARVKDFLSECEKGSETCSPQGVANALAFMENQAPAFCMLRGDTRMGSLLPIREGGLMQLADPGHFRPTTRFVVLVQPAPRP